MLNLSDLAGGFSIRCVGWFSRGMALGALAAEVGHRFYVVFLFILLLVLMSCSFFIFVFFD